MNIEQMFQNPITREINGVIKAGARDNDTVLEEIKEYVVTTEIRKNMREFFSAYASSFANKKNENIGIWLAGFFGSGKSHLLKMLGTIIENKSYNGKTVTQYFEEKLGDDKLLFGDLSKSSSVPTDVILFDIGKVTDQKKYENGAAMVVAFLKKFNESIGFDKSNIKVADFERDLWRQGKYDEFKSIYLSIAGVSWEEDRAKLSYREKFFLKTIDKMDLPHFDEDSAERWLEREEDPSISVETFSDIITEYLDRSEPNKRIIFLIDEIGQYIGSDSQLMLNLQGISEEIGRLLKGRVWIVVTSQKGITEILNEREFKVQDFSKIQDRFKIRLPLSSVNIDEVIKKRLLEKTPEMIPSLKSYYDSNKINIDNLITFDGEAKLNLYKHAEDFAETYPFVPYQFFLLQEVYDKIRKMSHSGDHQSKGERSLLNAFHDSANNVKGKELGTLVPFYSFYDSIEQFLDDTVRKPILHAEQRFGMNEFEVNLLKLLYLLKGVDNIKTTVDNLASFMITNISENRADLKTKIIDALKKLESKHLIQRNGNIYTFLTDAEQDINREIKEVKIDNSELSKYIYSRIFEDIFDSNNIRIRQTGNSYIFGKKVDDQFFSTQNNKLVVHVITPYHDYYGKPSEFVMYTSRDSGHLFVTLNSKDEFMEEIRELIQIERYVTDKKSKNPPPNIIRILDIKASEKKERQERIRAYIETALENASFMQNGTAIEIKSKSARERLQDAIENYALGVYRNSVLIKSHYTEQKIKSLIQVDYADTLYYAEKDFAENVNKEALKEMVEHIKDLSDRNDVITLKKLSDKFEEVPYGWDLIDIQGLLTELFVFLKVDLEYETEELNPKDRSAIDKIIKVRGANQERLIIKQKEEKPLELIRKAIQTMKTIFGASLELEENRFEKGVKKYLEEQVNLINLNLKNYDSPKLFKYPGKSDLEEYRDFLKHDILEYKGEKSLCENIIKNFEDFDELKTKADTVKDFFDKSKVKLSIFNGAIKEIENLKANDINYGHLLESEEVKKIKEVLTAREPYSLLHTVPPLITKIKEEITTLITKEKDKFMTELQAKEEEYSAITSNIQDELVVTSINKKIDELRTKITNCNDNQIFMYATLFDKLDIAVKDLYKNYIKNKIASSKAEITEIIQEKDNVEHLVAETNEKFRASINKIQEAKTISEIEDELDFINDEKHEILNELKGIAKKKEKVVIKVKRQNRKNIESPEQVDEYISTLEKELKDLRTKLLEAVQSNKKVDILEE